MTRNDSNTIQHFIALDQGEGFHACKIRPDSLPVHELVKKVIECVGQKAKSAMHVEVRFNDLLNIAKLVEETWWTDESAEGINVPLGPSGARDFQLFEMGSKGVHALIVGRTGSGKTNLLHVIILTLALKYSPEELELYLIDFKKGVGFKCYADEHKLPHARAIAIESEREFGISVLQRLDKELEHRAKLFRDANGSEKISEYRKYTKLCLPRIILIADEFQEFFTIDDALAREASLLFDRIVRQGLAFGIHLILGTQTLAGSYGMNRSTLDQMSIRIALQCTETDSRMILGDNNPGARYLSRPGEAIYNAENGLVQANKLFQVANITDEDKTSFLKKIRDRSNSRGDDRQPIVFEGHEPANIEMSEHVKLLRKTEHIDAKKGVSAWLGEPIAIKEPTRARLRRQAGANIVAITRDEEQGIGVLAGALITLAIQHTDEACRFIIADYSTADADWAWFFDYFCDKMPHEGNVFRRRQVPDTVAEILREVETRHEYGRPSPSNLFFVVAGMHRARELKKDEDDYSTESGADSLLKILQNGPEVGVHCLVWADTTASFTRIVGRKALAEFGVRVAGVMSNDDSQSLIDDSGASKIDRPHRMLLFDEEQPGVLEKFRPFSVPKRKWLEDLATQLKGD